ncbi:GNAT family N-acetyltransferase [Desulfogranum mediterraneum]|uniref:GNAT family N-acetyltransferase n=1 Tax=Desulfogranum mediterraneum TaxID=160661 RepID=UPI00040C94AA|nr:N-acetyltransferase [Desulfogranum mediterraneum]
MEVRTASALEREAVATIHQQAFGPEMGAVTAELVRVMLEDPTAMPMCSLVAVEGGQLTGHVLFTRATIGEAPGEVSARILAPLAVLPEVQHRGVGGKLIRAGLRCLRASGVELVFVLGHPGYYPRYGFRPAGVLGYQAPYPIPEEHAAAWMVQELTQGVIGRVRGQVHCCATLDQPEHWRE